MLANTGGLNQSLLLGRWSVLPLGLPAVPDVSNSAFLITNKSRSCITATAMMQNQTRSPSDDRKPGNMTELYGATLAQFAWEKAIIRVQH